MDPLTKVVHVPSLRPKIQKAALEIGHISGPLEALMFAIYSAAVMSLKDDECKTRFGEHHKTLLSRYASATGNALDRVKLRTTTSVVVVQALVLHLISVRDLYNPRYVRRHSELTYVIAKDLGLHRDGTTRGLSPFKTEICRRVWWQLEMNNFRTAELGGLGRFSNLGADKITTRLPTNLNDDDLHPSMGPPVTESRRPTDMIFCLLMPTLRNFAANRQTRFRQQGQDGSLRDEHRLGEDLEQQAAEGADFVDEVEEFFETKFLRCRNLCQPLQIMAQHLGQSAIAHGRFMSRHPRRWANQERVLESERQLIWNTSITLLEVYDTIQSGKRLQGFAWHGAYSLHWHAFIHVLETLRTTPLKPDAPKAWQLVESIFENHPDLSSNVEKIINREVGSLCVKAFSAREAALAAKGQYTPPTPKYIANLRSRQNPAGAGGISHHHQHQNGSALQNTTSSDLQNLNTTTFLPPEHIATGSSANHPGTGSNFAPPHDDTTSAPWEWEREQPFDWTQWDTWLGDLDTTKADFSIGFHIVERGEERRGKRIHIAEGGEERKGKRRMVNHV